MDILGSLAIGFEVALTPTNLMMAFIGCILGTIIGLLPGIGPSAGIVILVPLTFSLSLDPASALILMTSIYTGSMYGGRITSILMNIPGDETAIMTCIDGYPMAKKGRASDALAIAAFSSFIGGTIAVVAMTIFAPMLAKAALYFGPSEYFALYVMALATVGGVSGVNPAKTLLSASIGLVISTVGIDSSTSVARYTFGSYELYDGINFAVAAIGLFAISEYLIYLEAEHKAAPKSERMDRLQASWRTLLSTAASVRGSIVGFFVGILPGAGATIGSYLAYAFEKRWSDKNGTFGKGDARGIAAPEAANNSAATGALIPMLTLGVPGSTVTAIILAVLVGMNITPGPLLFSREPEVVWGLIGSLYVGNLMLLVLNVPLVGLFAKILLIPNSILMPLIVVVSFVGVYSISHSLFDLLLMAGFGVLGYAFRKMEISLVPMVLGAVLGNDMELSLRRALGVSDGDWSVLISSPISATIHAVTIIVLVSAFVLSYRKKQTTPAAESAES